jgi:hypothetical protein
MEGGVESSGSRDQSSGCRVNGFVFKVSGLGLTVYPKP